MPKNKGKGGKNRKRGTNKNEPAKRELVIKEEGQEYAQCTKMLGNGRIEAMCFDGVKRLATIRGKMRKKVWVNVGDIILLGLREFQDGKADVILKYQPDEARKLMKKGQIPETTTIHEKDETEARDGWDYEDEDDDEEATSNKSEASESESESEDEDEDEEEESEEEKEKEIVVQKSSKYAKDTANAKFAHGGKKGKGGDDDVDIDAI